MKSEYENAMEQLSGWRMPTDEEKEYIEGCILKESKKDKSSGWIIIIPMIIAVFGMVNVLIQFLPKVLTDKSISGEDRAFFLGLMLLIAAGCAYGSYIVIHLLSKNFSDQTLQIIRKQRYRVCDVRYNAVAYSYYSVSLGRSNTTYDTHTNVWDLEDRQLLSIPDRKGKQEPEKVPYHHVEYMRDAHSGTGTLIAVNMKKANIDPLFVYPRFGEERSVKCVTKMLNLRMKNKGKLMDKQ